ncbi:hypothetical protein H6P81_001641 [Aristolochia fimbriata]|uniref:Valerianol synthase n=1 Tax=Aristolochia fimbriata TaxID=158543 RepID=A0AAV7F7R1_ARIFI|nr:hypothetical protein H6P81_001641 [Aristolochia fimbriata]
MLLTTCGPSSANTLHQKNNKAAKDRRSANFHASAWGDFFLHLPPSDQTNLDATMWEEIEDLKQQVIRGLIIGSSANDEPPILTQIKLIDLLQCTGIAYHFGTEIEEAVRRISTNITHSTASDQDDLYFVALRFRLLRQHGHDVSSNVFLKFKEERGMFNTGRVLLSGNDHTEAMLSLYEAAHFATHGEEILDEALSYTKTHLMAILSSSQPQEEESLMLMSRVALALELPLHRTTTRLRTKKFLTILSNYHDRGHHVDKDHDHTTATVVKLAKLDFNRSQAIHRKELQEISRWWKEMEVPVRLPFARDRIVEGYYWTLEVLPEPQYERGRKVMTKIIALTSIMDDIYDVHGTLEELRLFTEAIDRWEEEALDQLPEYMKLPYSALLETMKQTEEELEPEGKSFRTFYLKEALKSLTKGYFMEAKWFYSDYVPNMEEYMRTALITSAYYMLTVASFIGMGEEATKDVFEWALGDQKLIKAAATISRLVDDIQTHKDEQEWGHVASAVECFMNEYGVSEEEACARLREMVASAWKDINQGYCRPTTMPLVLHARVLKLAAVIETLYKQQDGYTNSSGQTRERIRSLGELGVVQLRFAPNQLTNAHLIRPRPGLGL